MDQVALASQEPVDPIGQVARDLLDPRVVRMAGQTGDVHGQCGPVSELAALIPGVGRAHGLGRAELVPDPRSRNVPSRRGLGALGALR
ncbi:MAG TPA: hypothetical protein VHT91_50625 [Kofleriaceae bacterium]|nr:hypothetical protein [Kofleriaceae bacterium]